MFAHCQWTLIACCICEIFNVCIHNISLVTLWLVLYLPGVMVLGWFPPLKLIASEVWLSYPFIIWFQISWKALCLWLLSLIWLIEIPYYYWQFWGGHGREIFKWHWDRYLNISLWQDIEILEKWSQYGNILTIKILWYKCQYLCLQL